MWIPREKNDPVVKLMGNHAFNEAFMTFFVVQLPKLFTFHDRVFNSDSVSPKIIHDSGNNGVPFSSCVD